MPTKAYPSSVGHDLYALCLTEDGSRNSVLIPPGNVRPIRTGLAFGGFTPPRVTTRKVDPRSTNSPTEACVEEGYTPSFLAVCSRSGLAERGIFVANAPGIIDPEYRGELIVLLFNGGNLSYYVRSGDRIAQLVVAPVVTASLEEIEDLQPTSRGDKGFGSSGR